MSASTTSTIPPKAEGGVYARTIGADGEITDAEVDAATCACGKHGCVLLCLATD